MLGLCRIFRIAGKRPEKSLPGIRRYGLRTVGKSGSAHLRCHRPGRNAGSCIGRGKGQKTGLSQSLRQQERLSRHRSHDHQHGLRPGLVQQGRGDHHVDDAPARIGRIPLVRPREPIHSRLPALRRSGNGRRDRDPHHRPAHAHFGTSRIRLRRQGDQNLRESRPRFADGLHLHDAAQFQTENRVQIQLPELYHPAKRPAKHHRRTPVRLRAA